jgi:uncharacterized protein YkwD
MRRYIVVGSLMLLAVLGVVAMSASASARDASTSRSGGHTRPTRTPVPTRTATSVPSATPFYTSTPVPSATPNNEGPRREVETISLINQRRSAMGLQTLRTNSALTTSARRLSLDIGPLGLCQHNGTDGSTPWSRIADAGYTGSATGEVVGCGYPTSQEVVTDWWGSPAHYDILTNATANDIGCGWWINPSGYGWVTCDLGQSP